MSADARPVRVLIVDDDPGVLYFVGRVLERAGYVTVSATSGREALEAAARLGSVDLLVTDLRMPPMNGDELARQLRRTEPDLKVLYLTGCSDYFFTERGTPGPSEAFLEKPCDMQMILTAVTSILDTHPRRTGDHAS